MRKRIKLIILLFLIFPYSSLAADSLADRLSGRILLQVERNGEAWYVEPASKQRAYLGRPEDAFRIMRELGLGITESDFSQFKASAPARLSGRILLRVQANGEAYYVHPQSLALHYLGRPADAFRVMREQGVGITNSDLDSISLNENYAVSEEVKQKIAEFINNNLMQPGNAVTVKDIVAEGEMYKVVVLTSGGQEIISYTDKAVTKFFPQVMDIAEIEAQKKADSASNSNTSGQATADVTKAKKTSVELFVMSHCPYGVQMEKGLLPVIKALGDKMDFELKFCDYAMHGQKELDEQLNQYCIQKNEPEKLIVYLECFLEDGDGDVCLDQTDINIAQLNSCFQIADNEYKITENFENNIDYRGRFPGFAIYKDDASKYSISGSPSLVINGQKISSARDSASLLKIICAGYENPPEECDTELSSDSPAPGFGFSAAGANGGSASGDCGS